MKTTLVNPPDITRRDAIKGSIGAVSLAVLGTGAAVPAALSAVSVVATTDTAEAQQTSRATSQVTEPATGILMHQDYARTIAQMAYVWGWPIVNMINRRAAITQAPQPGQPYHSKPGFYLLVGPRWRGLKPAGITDIMRCSTSLGAAIPRVFMDDTPEDRKAIQPVINQIAVYPLKDFTGKMKTIEWSKVPNIPGPKSTGEETKWVVPEKFFDQFGEALDIVDPLPGEEALYGQFRLLLDTASKDPELKKVLVATAVETEQKVIHPFFEWKHNGRPAGNGWNRSVNNAQYGLDYFNRTGTSKSNMFDNRPNETQYYYTDFDDAGAELSGGGSYEVTFAAGQEPPVNGFWSLTLYNDKHLFHPNDLKRYSLGTKNKNLKRNADGSLTLYAGAKSPGADKVSNWLPAPNGRFSLYIRAYWGKEGILDGSWKPPVIRKIA